MLDTHLISPEWLMKPSTLKHRFEYRLAAFFAGLFRILPVSWAVSLGMGLGWIGYKLIGIRKKVMLDNLRQAFPEKSRTEREKIALKSYCHWGGMAAEFALLPKMDERRFRRYVEFDGEEVLDKVAAGGKGGLIISGHLGNWEWMGAMAARLGYGVTYIVASQSNKLVDRMMDDFRRSQGIETWQTRIGAKGVLKSVKNNRMIALMIDQDAGRNCVFVDFFGLEASTHRGPAVFHLKTGSPLIISTCIRVKGPHYRVLFEETDISVPEGSTEDKYIHIMAELTKLLEAKIREHPEQYFWMHKRWKTEKRVKGKGKKQRTENRKQRT